MKIQFLLLKNLKNTIFYLNVDDSKASQIKHQNDEYSHYIIGNHGKLTSLPRCIPYWPLFLTNKELSNLI